MGKLAILVTIISLLATSCTWRDCARNTAYAVGSTAVLITGNGDRFGGNENIGGQAAADLIDIIFCTANATE